MRGTTTGQATPPDLAATVRAIRADDTEAWNAVADAADGVGHVPGLVAALEAKLDGTLPGPSRLRALLALARLGQAVDAGNEDAARAGDPLAWLDLALACETDERFRAALLTQAASDGTLQPRDMAPRLIMVRAAAGDDLAAWMGELVNAFPPGRRPSAEAVLVAGFGIMPAEVA